MLVVLQQMQTSPQVGFAIGVAFPNRKRLENQTALAYFKTILQSRLQPYVTYTRNDRLELYEWN